MVPPYVFWAQSIPMAWKLSRDEAGGGRLLFVIAKVISQFVGSESSRRRLGIFGQHGRVPGFVFSHQSLKEIRLPSFEVRSFERIIDNIEEESVAGDLQPLHIAIAHGSLLVGAETPKQFSRNRRSAAGERGQKAHTIWRMRGIGLKTCCGQKRGQPVHTDRYLICSATGTSVAGPANDSRDPQSAFEQFRLFAGKRPGVRKTFTTVVAGEDNNG